jgi:hypothetical protein
MRTVLGLALAVAAIRAAAADAPRVAITALATPTGENLVRNPSFEEGEGDWPEVWSWTSNQPTRVTRFWAEEALTGSRSAGTLSELSAGSGYWLQMVPVEANREYLLRARVKIDAGKVLVRALGHDEQGVMKSFDKRAYDFRRTGHLLVPVFWRPEWVIGMHREAWLPVEVSFDTRCDPAPTSVQVHVGSYFREGVSYFDDVYLGPGELKLTYAVHGVQLQSVRLLDAGGEELADSGPLTDGTDEFEGSADKLPLVGPYCVEARGRDGKLTRAWYPAPPEGGEQ